MGRDREVGPVFRHILFASEFGATDDHCDPGLIRADTGCSGAPVVQPGNGGDVHKVLRDTYQHDAAENTDLRLPMDEGGDRPGPQL